MVELIGHSELLATKTIVVTGAGRGIGAAIARDTAAHGANVVVSDVDVDRAHLTAQQIRDGGGVAQARQVDVSDWSSVAELVEATVADFGSLDGMVCNAGRFSMGPMEDSTPAMWEEMIGTNLLGVAICGQTAARRMLTQGSGAIVTVTSGAQCGMPAMSVYGATKGAVASLTYTWALELGPRGIRVNAMSPMADTRLMDVNREYRAQYPGGEQLPSQPAPEANAPVVTFLLSDLARDVNGQVVRINGGDLALMSRPAVLSPVLRRDVWTPETIAEAFHTQLVSEQPSLRVVDASRSRS